MNRWTRPVPEGGDADRMAAAREALERSKPYGELFDLEVIEATSELVRVRMAFAAGLTRFNGTLHGGAIMTLADAAGVVCATLNANGDLAGTQQFNISFLRPVSGGHVDAVARTVHSGRTSLVLETMLEDAEGRKVAGSRGEQRWRAGVTQPQAVRVAE